MWIYEKRLEYPVNITKTCPKTAQLIISQYGGPDGELSASMRYLAQRYSMPVKAVGGLLTDIGTEELAHMEMICAMVYQLTKNLTPEQAKTAGFDAYYIDHTAGIWPQAASALPFSAVEFQSKGDALTDLTEDLAAEQKAVVPVTDVVETVRRVDKDGSTTVNRDDYKLVQTPQVFDAELLKRAYEQPYQTGFTDDASVVESLGVPVCLTAGNRENIKITTPFDLAIAEALLNSCSI